MKQGGWTSSLLIVALRPEEHLRLGFSQLITAFPPWGTNALAVMALEHLHLTENESGVSVCSYEPG